MKWCHACNMQTEHRAGSRYLYCARCLNNNYNVAGHSMRDRDAATIQPVHTPPVTRQYRVVQAMPGTDGYGWQVETLGTDGRWYNFFGQRPKNQAQVSASKPAWKARIFKRLGRNPKPEYIN